MHSDEFIIYSSLFPNPYDFFKLEDAETHARFDDVSVAVGCISTAMLFVNQIYTEKKVFLH